jgi:hypothetical protein
MQEELLFPSFSYYLAEAAKEHYREVLIHHKLWVLGGKAGEEDRSA